FWVGLCIYSALKFRDIETQLQWPNDLLLQGKKVGGILCVSRGQGARAWVACGVGINVHRTNDPGYATLDPPPAFIEDVNPMERSELLTAILQQYETSTKLLDHPHLVPRRWEEAAKLKGTPYRILVDGENEPFEGTAVRIAHSGALVLDVNGSERSVNLADARVLR
ncbi:MAG: hypothetical protein JO233_06430, partial [Candidatus Eremiobacteraeota bacterium]|nr:hypothetical protein [Candidatus Eremiobacteraeota bacterium]